ncbi:restriction endonuclease [Halolamina sp. CBA1230]|uniref:restriction endonuclease n=1 Tax=Halolamina sp. CBA1230 TaxID=1853690 RepID=UPI0009A2083F|nr:restriction endonuclease [Halolamina sp. CBA1230]QKY20741.1 restriction endonuclease [Halolamina sp. CBA1230]
MLTCPNCDAEVTASSTYCRECGHKLSEFVTADSAPSDGDDGETGTPTASTTRTVTKEVSVSASSLDQQALKAHLQSMDEYEFEHLVADLWSEMGWDTTVSQASVDAGLDVVAEKHTPYHQKKVIQAKRYGDSTTVGGPDIQQYASLKQQVDDADSVVVVTTSSFTSSGESRASDLNVKLVDGDDLVGMVADLEAYDVVDDYLDITRTVTEEVEVEPEPEPEPETELADEPEPVEIATSTEQEETGDGVVSGASVADSASAFLGFTHWNWVAAVSGVLTFVVVPVSDVLFFTLLLATALAMVFDMRYVAPQTTWDPSMLLYVGGLLVVLAPLPVYLINRYRYFSRHVEG